MYRKKPVIIEAMQLVDDDRVLVQIEEWITGEDLSTLYGVAVGTIRSWIREHDGYPIKTLEGTMIASFGDYIIKGVQGEFYPCKPDIFHQTYELVKSVETL